MLHTFYQDLPDATVEKLKKIKLVVLDVDGTISDGGIYLDRTDNELKKFNCKDGMGVSLLLKAGIAVALLTGRISPLTERRAKELRITYVIQGQMEKEPALLDLIAKCGLTEDEVAVLGDDINDLPLYQHSAVAACPSDGYHYMKTIATLVLTSPGGQGAVRELSDLILMAQGLTTPEGNPTFLKERQLKLNAIGQ